VKPFSAHDVGIAGIATSKTVVCQGYELSITTKILNYGINTETFTITVYAYTLVITQTQITLKSRDSANFTFTMNTAGRPYGNYIISAEADPVPSETDTTDNTFTDGLVLLTIAGDVSSDCICDMLDISMLIDKFMATPSAPRWDSNCDINSDNSVDMLDISIAIDHFMEQW
jgi:hypothetical protein